MEKQQYFKVFKTTSAPDLQEQMNEFLVSYSPSILQMNTVVSENDNRRTYVVTIIYTISN